MLLPYWRINLFVHSDFYLFFFFLVQSRDVMLLFWICKYYFQQYQKRRSYNSAAIAHVHTAGRQQANSSRLFPFKVFGACMLQALSWPLRNMQIELREFYLVLCKQLVILTTVSTIKSPADTAPKTPHQLLTTKCFSTLSYKYSNLNTSNGWRHNIVLKCGKISTVTSKWLAFGSSAVSLRQDEPKKEKHIFSHV